jgi:hypothetical protein
MLKAANQRTASISHGVGPSHIVPALFGREGFSGECRPVPADLSQSHPSATRELSRSAPNGSCPITFAL